MSPLLVVAPVTVAAKTMAGSSPPGAPTTQIVDWVRSALTDGDAEPVGHAETSG